MNEKMRNDGELAAGLPPAAPQRLCCWPGREHLGNPDPGSPTEPNNRSGNKIIIRSGNEIIYLISRNQLCSDIAFSMASREVVSSSIAPAAIGPYSYVLSSLACLACLHGQGCNVL